MAILVKTIEQARQQLWRVSDWRDEYNLTYLVASVSPGPCKTITGEVVNIPAGGGSCLWSGCSLFPGFASEAAAVECAKQNGLKLV